MLLASVIFIVLFALISVIDGIYFHIFKYKLYSRPESVQEHLTHTIRAFLFAPIVYIFFAENHGGWILWLGLIIVVVDFAVETWDVLIERNSRASLGGLSTAEYWVHVYSITFRVAAIAFAVAAKPGEAWSLSSPLVLSKPFPTLLVAYSWTCIVFTLIAAFHHLWLLSPRHRKAT